MEQNAVNLNQAIRWLGALSIVPGIILPFYQYFIHGGRDAASIMQHPAPISRYLHNRTGEDSGDAHLKRIATRMSCASWAAKWWWPSPTAG